MTEHSNFSNMQLLTSDSEVAAAFETIHTQTEETQPDFTLTCTKKWDGDAALLELHYPGYVQEYKINGPISVKQDTFAWYFHLPRDGHRRIHPDSFVYKKLEPYAQKLLAQLPAGSVKDDNYHIFSFRVEVLVNQCGPFRARNFLTSLLKQQFWSRKNPNEDYRNKEIQQQRSRTATKMGEFNKKYSNQYVHIVILDETAKLYTKKARDRHQQFFKLVNDDKHRQHLSTKKNIAYWTLGEETPNQMRLLSSTQWHEGFTASYAARMWNLHELFRTREPYQVSNLDYQILFVTPLIHISNKDRPTTPILHSNLLTKTTDICRFLQAKNATTAVEGCVLSVETSQGLLKRFKVKRRTVWSMPREILVNDIDVIQKEMNWKSCAQFLLPANEILFICLGNAWMASEIETQKKIQKVHPPPAKKAKGSSAHFDPPHGWDLQIAKQYNPTLHEQNLNFEKSFGTIAAERLASLGVAVTKLDTFRLRKMAGLQAVNLSRITQISKHGADCNLVRFYGEEGCQRAQQLFASFTNQNKVTSKAEHGPPPLHRTDEDDVAYTSPMPNDKDKDQKYDETKFILVKNLPCYQTMFNSYTNLRRASTNPFWGDFFRLQFIFRYLLENPEKTKEWWPSFSLPLKQWVLNHVRNSKIYRTQYDAFVRNRSDTFWIHPYDHKVTEKFKTLKNRFEHYMERMPSKTIGDLRFAQNQLPSPSQSMFHHIMLETHPPGTRNFTQAKDMWKNVWGKILTCNQNWTGQAHKTKNLRDRIENVFRASFIEQYDTFQNAIREEYRSYDALLNKFAVRNHPIFFAEHENDEKKFEYRLHILQSNFKKAPQHKSQEYLQYVTPEDFDLYFKT